MNNKIFVIASGCVLLIYVALVINAGFCFPIPWGDEPLFYYPAKAFANTGYFFAEELHPDRMIYWQPPGYYIITGVILKIFGADFSLFRYISLGFAVLATYMLFNLLYKWKPELQFTILLLGLLTIVSRHWIVMGNMGRMESIIAFCMLLAAWLVWHKRHPFALIIGIAACYVHPNGIFIAAFGFIWLIIDKFDISKTPTLAWVLLGIMLAAWIWFFYDIYLHWEGFVNDFRFQSVSRDFSSVEVLILRPHFFIYILLWGFNFFFSRQLNVADRPFHILQFLALTFFIIRSVGLGLCYGVFNIMAMYISLVQFTYLMQLWVGRNRPHWPQRVALSIILLCIITGAYAARVINLPLKGYSDWIEMQMPAFGEKYMTKEEMQQLTFQLNQKTPANSWVYFFPEADGALFDHLKERKWRHFIRVMDDSRPDYYLLHYAPQIGATVTEEADSIFYRMAAEHGPDTLLSNKTGHIWVLLKNCNNCLTEGRLTVKKRLALQ